MSSFFKWFQVLNDQTVLVQTVQFSISTQFKCQTVLFGTYIGPYQVLLLRARLNLGTMAMKEFSTFPKAPALPEPHHHFSKCHIHDTRWGKVLPLCRDTVGVFCSPSRLGIATTPTSVLIQGVVPVMGPIYASNRSIWKLKGFDRSVWNHITESRQMIIIIKQK